MVDKVRFVHAGCGMNALSGLQKYANSIHCISVVGLISASGNLAFAISLTLPNIRERYQLLTP
ncbi:hypothetical protein ABL420_003551 [Escherichia albertii]